jgi:hypothetical protein
MTKLGSCLASALLCGAVGLFAPRPAVADTQFLLDAGNSTGLGLLSGPYATADVALTSSTSATVTFDALANSEYTYLMGSTGAVAVNVNAASWTIGDLMGSNTLTGFKTGSLSDGGAVNSESSFGSFNQTIDGSGGFTKAFTEISFTLTNTGGAWTTSDDVLTGVAIKGFACANPCIPANGSAGTGYASVAAVDPVPEPQTYVMLLAGLGVLALFGRRRFKSPLPA